MNRCSPVRVALPNFSARSKGLYRAARWWSGGGWTREGRRRYRHNVWGLSAKKLLWKAARTASISYRTSSGPKHDSHTASWIAGYSVRHSRHCKPRTYPVNGPPNFRCGRKGVPKLTLRATIIQIALIGEFGLEY